MVRNAADFVQVGDGAVLLVKNANTLPKLLLGGREINFRTLDDGCCIAQFNNRLPDRFYRAYMSIDKRMHG